MHYIVFLMEHNLAPYRDIADMNLPGAYLADYAVMHTLGGGSLAWRVFDLGLMSCCTLSMISIARPNGRFAGFFAGALFTLVHGRDGIYSLGERDLVVATLGLLGFAALLRATRHESARWMVLFGLSAGLAASIKPTFLPLGPIVLLALFVARRKYRQPSREFAAYGVIGLTIPLLGVLVFLWREHAIDALLVVCRGILRYHAALDHKHLGFLLLHSFSPLMPLVILWACCALSNRKKWIKWEGFTLLIGAAMGLISYVVQGKGYAYHRYPFIAFLLLIMSIDFARAVKSRGWPRIFGWAGIAFGVAFLAPISAVQAAGMTGTIRNS